MSPRNMGLKKPFLSKETLEKLVRNLLLEISMYQNSKYFNILYYVDPRELEVKLDQFFEIAVYYVCSAVRRNGGICLQELLMDYDLGGALEELENEIKNFTMEGRWGRFVAYLLKLSRELYEAKKYTLGDKIYLFDKLIHAMHIAGNYPDEFSFEEASIFGLDIPRIKREVDEIINKKLGIVPPPRRPLPS